MKIEGINAQILDFLAISFRRLQHFRYRELLGEIVIF